MKTPLGISVYPDIEPLEAIVEYFKLASKYDVDFVFTSMFSVEGTKEEVLSYFRKMIEEAHTYHLKVMLDVNPQCFEKVGANYDDLAIFDKIRADMLRMDFSYGTEKNKILIHNPYNIEIVFNASKDVVQHLTDEAVNVCHNFYPQRYTAKKWNQFQEENETFKQLAKDCVIGAFVSSNVRPSHGVWDAVCGLPTVEMMRDYPIDLQARLLLATNHVDYLCIGNAYASQEEFESLQTILKEEKEGLDMSSPIVRGLLEFLNNDNNTTLKQLKIQLDPGVSDLEKEIVYEFGPHIDVGDSSEWIWRTRLPRFKYNKEKYALPCRKVDIPYFEIGDVVMVNDNYAHYRGEIQIVKIPIVNDGTRNRIGHLNEGEYTLFELVKDGDIIKFIQ